MPKRRAKTKLPPLIFEESPVHIAHNPPDLVFASDNPPTADVVQLNQDVSFDWVSPQFHGQPTPGPKRRRCRTQYSTLSTTTRSRHTSGHSNQTTCGRLNRSQHPHRQFPALDFIGDPVAIQSPPSPCDNISLDEQDHVKCKRQEGIVALPDGDTPVAGQFNTPKSQEEVVNEPQSESDLDESQSVKPRRIKASTARRKTGKIKKKKTRLKDLAAQLDFTPEDPGDYAQVGQQLDAISENIPDQVELLSSDTKISKKSGKKEKNETNAGSPILTQLRPKSKQRPERKRLFDQSSDPGDYQNNTSNVEQYMNEFDSIKPISSRCNDKDRKQLTSEDSVEQRSTPLNKSRKCNGELENADAVTPNSHRRSQRLMALREGMFSSLLTLTPTQKSVNNYNVLVYDTPEEDYGLTHRQRRLRLLKHSRRKSQAKYLSRS